MFALIARAFEYLDRCINRDLGARNSSGGVSYLTRLLPAVDTDTAGPTTGFGSIQGGCARPRCSRRIRKKRGTPSFAGRRLEAQKTQLTNDLQQTTLCSLLGDHGGGRCAGGAYPLSFRPAGWLASHTRLGREPGC